MDKNKKNLVFKMIATIFVAAVVMVVGRSVQAVEPVELLLSPDIAEVEINREINVDFKIKPQGRNVVGVDITFEYIPDYLDITNAVAANGFNKIEVTTNTPGMKRFSFTNLGNPVSAEITIATLTIKGIALQQSADVMLSSAKVALSDGTSLTYSNGGLTFNKGVYSVVGQAAPTNTPPPSPEKPSITSPTMGQKFVISSDPSSNRPALRWNMMANPAGSIKQMGVRVKKVADDPNDPSDNVAMDCSNNVVIDRWWFSQTAADNQNPNSVATCKKEGAVSGEADNADLLVEGRKISDLANFTYQPNIRLSPGKYFVTVYNFDDTYRADANTTLSGSDSSVSSNFRSSYYFTVSCPANAPVWDGSSSKCVSARTQSYSLSENLNDLADGTIQWKDYTEDPIPHTFSNPVPGQVRTLFVRFKDEQGNVNPPFNKPPISKSIKYLGANPAVSNISCGFNSDTGTGSKVVITGSNLGSSQGKGGVKIVGLSGTANATIASWGKVVIQPTREPVFQGGITGTVTPTLTITPTVSPTPSVTGTLTVTPTGAAVAQTQDRVIVRVKERLEGTVNVELTVDDGRKVVASCAVDTNTVSFATKTQCRPPGSFAADNVRVQIYENITGARPLYDSRTNPITLSSDGSPQWTPPPLEIGKDYSLVIKAPKSLAVKRSFTVLEGTNILEDIIFPVGDIAPASAPDGVINAVDKSELIRQWSATTDVARAGDFNMDGRINSLDYSCMRENINRAAGQFVRN